MNNNIGGNKMQVDIHNQENTKEYVVDIDNVIENN